MHCLLVCFLLVFIAYFLLLCHCPVLPVVERESDYVVVEAEDSHPCLADCTQHSVVSIAQVSVLFCYLGKQNLLCL